ncbi:hypothetical protein MT349_01710 [Rathayibacter caricis]|uniref:hypothetical protein n=1 Tax=Rathayibacter caricis TaxID=110936 RepID=UPI001FB2D8FA|nr:hypothetical protein [Rathayibacter caricis]MCJ1694489.1 hypothetical protein [Rathayibacter caricis]
MARSRTRDGRRIAALAVVLAAVPLLSGCAGPIAFSDFGRERTDADALPDLGVVTDGIDPESARYAGSVEGLEVYLGSSVERGDQCVIVDAGAQSSSACTTGGGTVSSGPGAWTVQLHPDGGGPEDSSFEDWTPLGENVSVRAD